MQESPSQYQPFLIKKKCSKFKNHSNLVIVGYEYNNEDFRDELFDFYHIQLPSLLNCAAITRKAEYLAGRVSAIDALQLLGIQIDNIPTGKHRNPLWPSGVVASITHTNSTAYCVAAYANEYQYLGIDLEKWIGHSVITEIKKSIITCAEEIFLQQCTMGFNKAFTLTFSAKESLFKAIYPYIGYYFDFDAVEIIQICVENRTFKLQLRQQLASNFNIGDQFSGYFDFDTYSIRTLILKPT